VKPRKLLVSGHEGCKLEYTNTSIETGARCYWCPFHNEWVFVFPVAKVYHYYDGTVTVFQMPG